MKREIGPNNFAVQWTLKKKEIKEVLGAVPKEDDDGK